MPESGEYAESYKYCDRCQLGRKDPDVIAWQRRHRCCLTVFVPEPEMEPPYPGRHMGLAPVFDREDTRDPELARLIFEASGDPEYPPEPTDVDGCPGGWYRTDFWYSVHRYTRARHEGGGYSQSTLLDRCNDRLVHEAISYYENQCDRWHSFVAKQALRHARQKAKH